MITVNANMTGNMGNWTFFGDGNGDAPWKQDHIGTIYPPAWFNPRFFRGDKDLPDFYASDLAKEDYAFLTSNLFDDVDISVKYKGFYGSVTHGGIIFRAAESTGFYVLDIVEMGRKAAQYELDLWVQYASGFRKHLARGFAWHSVIPERIVQCGLKNLDDWKMSCAEWISLRIQATGTYIRVSADGNVIFDLRDSTYGSGYTGLVAQGSVCFSDFTVTGGLHGWKEAFKTHEGEMPPGYFIPGGYQPEGFNAYPAVCCADNGDLMTTWATDNGEGRGRFGYTQKILFTLLKNGENEWSRPLCIYDLKGTEKTCSASSVFSHMNGDITCLVNEHDPSAGGKGKKTYCMRSGDGGRNWFNAGMLEINDDTPDGGKIYLYSPMQRLKDGKVIMTGYENDNSEGPTTAFWKDRSVIYISRDDGYTWGDPIYFDKSNTDHNECMVVETEPGKLMAFMRTLRAKNMWMSRSDDGGTTWSSLEQSDVTGDCPYIIRHSGGALVFFSRAYGAFIKLSYDNGKTWSAEYRISPASPMVGMAEMKDGRIAIIMHEGYRIPGKIRGQFFNITTDGPIPA
jgi:hypothetical protein